MRGNPKVIGFLMVFVACMVLATTGRNLNRGWEFDRTPLRSTAVIDRSWTTRGSKGSTHYHAAYHYEIDGVSYHATDVPVASWTYSQLHELQQVPIRYLPQDFKQTRIDWDAERNSQERNDEVGVAIALVMGIMGILIVIFAKPSQDGATDRKFKHRV